MRSRRLLIPLVPLALVGGTLSFALPASASADSSTLYVNNHVSNCSDTAEGRGTEANPFCTIQPAVDAAQPGQTVQVAPGSTYKGPIVLTSSGKPGEPITIQGNASRALSGAIPVIASTTAVGLTADHVHDVVVRGFGFRGYRQGAVLTDSTGITLDNNLFDRQATATGYTPTDDGILVEGATTGVTLSRNAINDFPAAGISLGSGVDGTIVTTNSIQHNRGGGIVAVDAPNTVVTSNTVTLNCGSGLVLDGSSSHAAVENNVIGSDDTVVSGTVYAPACTAQDQPELSVSSGSAVGSTLAYDIVHPRGTAQPYSWAGTGYADAASLLAGTAQGGHELNSDPGSTIPTGQSPAIDSADAGAVGELSTDYQGRYRVNDPLVDNSGSGDGGFVDRGAWEAQDLFNVLGLNSNVLKAPTQATFSFSAQVNNPWNDTASYSFDFGDRSAKQLSATPAAQHAYTATGTYTVTLTGTTASGVTRATTMTVTVNPPGPLTPGLLLEAGTTGEPLRVQVSLDAPMDPWPVTAATLDFGDGTTPATDVLGTIPHDYQQPGTYTVIGTISDAGGRTATVSRQISVGGELVPVTNSRILNTRSGVGAPKGALPAGHVLALKVAGVGGVPQSGATAVVLNVTETGATKAGYVTVYPGGDGSKAPTASNLNFKAGQTTQNLVTVPLGPDGTVDLIDSAGSADLLADVQGYYTTDGSTPGASYYGVLDPIRVLDTRSGAAKAKVGAGHTLTLTLPRNGYDASAVLLHVTATDATADTYVSTYTAGSPRPTVSDLNLGSGQTVSNLVVVQPNSNGQVTFYNHSGSTDLVVDLEGIFGPSTNDQSSYVALAPHRLLDTRHGTGAPLAKVGPGGKLKVKVAGQGGVPANVNAVLLNLTGTDASAGTYVTAYMPGTALPVASSLNVAPGETVPGLTLVRVSSDGYITLYNHAGTVDLIADVEGFYTDAIA